MDHHAREQCVFIVEQSLKNNESLKATACKFRTKCIRNSVLTSLTAKNERAVSGFLFMGLVEVKGLCQ